MKYKIIKTFNLIPNVLGGRLLPIPKGQVIESEYIVQDEKGEYHYMKYDRPFAGFLKFVIDHKREYVVYENEPVSADGYGFRVEAITPAGYRHGNFYDLKVGAKVIEIAEVA